MIYPSSNSETKLKRINNAICYKMEFPIEHPRLSEFEDALRSGKLELAKKILDNDPGLGDYNYREVMKLALEKGNISVARFMINNDMDFSGIRYGMILMEKLDKGDIKTADFMFRNRLGLRDLRWRFLKDDYEFSGNNQAAKWIENNFSTLIRAEKFRDGSVRPNLDQKI